MRRREVALKVKECSQSFFDETVDCKIEARTKCEKLP